MELSDLTAVLLPPTGPGHRRVGGLTGAERARRVLAAAGVDRVVAAGDPAATVPLPAGRYLVIGPEAVFDAEAVASLAAAGPPATAATAPLVLTDAAGAAEALAGRPVPHAVETAVAGLATDASGRAGARRAERALWCRYGPKPTDGLVCRYLNRPVSRPVTLLLVRTRVSPNALTVASFLVAVAGAALAGFGGRWWTMLLGGVLVQAGNALDGVDGEAARIALRVSRRGALLDTVLDRYADLAVLAGLALAAGGGAGAWVWAFAAAAASMLISYVNALAPDAPRRLLRRDVRLLLCALAAATGLPLWGLAVVAVAGGLDALHAFTGVIRRADRER